MASNQDMVSTRCYRVEYEVDVVTKQPKGDENHERWSGVLYSKTTANVRNKIAKDVQSSKLQNLKFSVEEITVEVSLEDFMWLAEHGRPSEADAYEGEYEVADEE